MTTLFLSCCHPQPRRSKATLRYVQMLAALLLTSCASPGTHATRPVQLDLPRCWSALPRSDGQTIGRQWWHDINDPFLDRLVMRGLQQNPTIDMALARVRQSRAGLQAASASQVPKLNASVSLAKQQGRAYGASNESHSLGGGVDASWELDLFGRLASERTAASAEAEASLVDLQGARTTLSAEIVQAYLAYRVSLATAAAQQGQVVRQEQLCQLMETAYRTGIATYEENERAKSALAQVKLQLESQQAATRVSLYQLELLTGSRPGSLQAELAGAGSTLHAPPPFPALGIPADVVRQRPDLAAAERKLLAQAARVRAAQKALYPSLKISGSFTMQLAGMLGVPGTALNNAGSILAAVTAPLLDGGRLRSEVELQDALYDEALASYRRSVQTALFEVENALVDLQKAENVVEQQQHSAQATDRLAQAARISYQSGLADYRSVLRAESDSLGAEISLLAAREQVYISLIKLYKALGGGWRADQEGPVERQ